MIRGDYMGYEPDYAGSRSKNRFKFEVYWGLNKFLESFRESQEFTMIFDFVCDIEIHHKDSYEFYQVKTSTARSYAPNNLISIGKKKNSIIGTLYKIRSTDIQKKSNLSKIAIVSNLYLQDPETPSEPNIELELTEISEKNRNKIFASLEKEFVGESIDISNIFFITTDLPLNSYKETMIGKVNTFYNDTYGEDVLKPAALLSVLVEEVQLKADFEGKLYSHEEVLEKKGLSTKRFEFILDRYSERMFSDVQKCREEIKLVVKNYAKRLDYFKDLPILLSDIKRNRHLKNLFESMTEDILKEINNFDDGETFDFARQYIKTTKFNFPIEYTETEKEILALVAFVKLEERV